MAPRLTGPGGGGRALAVIGPAIVAVVVVQTFAGMFVDIGSTLLVGGLGYLAGRMSAR